MLMRRAWRSTGWYVLTCVALAIADRWIAVYGAPPRWMTPLMQVDWFLPVVVFWAPALFIMRRFGQEMVASGFGLCCHCGFDLRGSPAVGCCPECGKAYDLPWTRREWILAQPEDQRAMYRAIGPSFDRPHVQATSKLVSGTAQPCSR
jgi:hypothetical protein